MPAVDITLREVGPDGKPYRSGLRKIDGGMPSTLPAGSRVHVGNLTPATTKIYLIRTDDKLQYSLHSARNIENAPTKSVFQKMTDYVINKLVDLKVPETALLLGTGVVSFRSAIMLLNGVDSPGVATALSALALGGIWAISKQATHHGRALACIGVMGTVLFTYSDITSGLSALPLLLGGGLGVLAFDHGLMMMRRTWLRFPTFA